MMTSSNNPAISVRPAISVIGGMVATPSLMKVYEPPHSVASNSNSASSNPRAGSRALVLIVVAPVLVAATAKAPFDESQAVAEQRDPMLRYPSNCESTLLHLEQ